MASVVDLHAVLLGLATNKADVMLPGGTLNVSWPDRNGSVLMSGPAVAVFDGLLTPDLVSTARDGLTARITATDKNLLTEKPAR